MKNVAVNFAVLALANALPSPQLYKRQMLSDFNDVDILNYALTLEHLEDKFYREALANYTQADFADAGFDETFYNNLKEVSYDETTHVSFLTTAIKSVGAVPVAECTYAFPSTTVTGFLGLANIIEGIGVSAYLGAAAQIAVPAYLTAAGSILTVEARHNAYLRANLGQVPFASPQDVPLTPNEVFTMASPFIVSCPPGNPSIPIKAFPGLSVTSTGTVASGDVIDVSTNKYILSAGNKTSSLYAAFVGPNGPLFTMIDATGNGMDYHVTVPTGINGQSYLLFTNCNETVSDNTVVAGPTFVEITNPLPSTVS